MEKKYSLILDKEFINYCQLNDIENIEEFAKDVFKQGFNITKYGWIPSKEVMAEKLKEVKEELAETQRKDIYGEPI